MATESGGVEFYVDADAAGVLKAGDVVHKTSAEMLSDFNKLDKATENLITKQVSLGRTVTESGKVIGKTGKEIKGATASLQKLIEKQKQLQSQSAKVNSIQNSLNKSIGKGSKGMASFGRSSGQVGIQMQQFIGQVQGGQSAMLALSQQAADIGIVMGAPLLGAIAGISASLVGMLIPSLMDSGKATEDLKKELEELAETQLLTAEQAKFLSNEESKSVTEKQKSIDKLKEQIEETETLIKRNEVLATVNESLTTSQKGVQFGQAKAGETTKDLNLKLDEQKASLSLLEIQMGKANSKIQQYNMALVGGVTVTEEQKESILGLISAVQTQARNIGKSNREIALSMEGLNAGQIKAINGAFDIIEAEEKRIKTAAELKSATDRENASLKSVTNSLNNKIAALQPLAQAQDEYNARMRLGLTQEEALPDAIQGQIDKIAELTEAKQKASEDQKNRQTVETEFKQLSTGLSEGKGSDLEKLEEELEAERELTNEYFALKLEDKTLQAEQITALEQQRDDTLTSIEERGADKRKRIAELEKQAKLNIAKSVFGSLAALMNSGSKKAFEIGKKAAIAQAAISGGEAAVHAWNSGMAVGGPWAPLVAAAYTAASLIKTGTQIQQIKSQSFGGANANSAASFSGGLPSVNTGQGGSGQGGGSQNISIAGIDSNSLVTGGQLVETLNQALGDGYTVNFAGTD